jgi:exoribonuclease II
MTQVTVDNKVITVLLGDAETFTPSSGSVLDVTVTVDVGTKLEIDDGTQTERVANNDVSISVIIDDSTTLISTGTSTSGGGVYISGFEVS